MTFKVGDRIKIKDEHYLCQSFWHGPIYIIEEFNKVSNTREPCINHADPGSPYNGWWTFTLEELMQLRCIVKISVFDYEPVDIKLP